MAEVKEAKPVKERKIFGQFRLLRGMHQEGGKIYRAGDIIDSASDLLKHNTSWGKKKYASVDDVVELGELDQDAESQDFYTEMSVAELQSIAEEGEISLDGCKTKKEIIARLIENE